MKVLLDYRAPAVPLVSGGSRVRKEPRALRVRRVFPVLPVLRDPPERMVLRVPAVSAVT